MSLGYLLPLALAIAGLLAAASLHRLLPPRAAAFALTGGLVATAITAASSLAALAADYTLDLGPWCRDALHGHAHVSVLAGSSALAAVCAGAVRSGRASLRQRRATRGPAPEGELLIVSSDTPTAFAVPGRHPHIVVSTGMLELLRPDERRAMLAHERAHLRHRHDLLITASEMAAAMLPPLRLAASRVRFATERWADQDAARTVGDPKIVARAIARASLARSEANGPALALSGSDITARVAALTSPEQPRRITDPAALGVLGLVTASLAASSVQLHHVGQFLQTLCLH